MPLLDCWPHLCSSFASQGVLVSVMLPASISSPTTMMAALGASTLLLAALMACRQPRCFCSRSNNDQWPGRAVV